MRSTSVSSTSGVWLDGEGDLFACSSEGDRGYWITIHNISTGRGENPQPVEAAIFRETWGVLRRTYKFPLEFLL